MGDMRIAMDQDGIVDLGAGGDQGVHSRQALGGVALELEGRPGNDVVHGDDDIEQALSYSATVSGCGSSTHFSCNRTWNSNRTAADKPSTAASSRRISRTRSHPGSWKACARSAEVSRTWVTWAIPGGRPAFAAGPVPPRHPRPASRRAGQSRGVSRPVRRAGCVSERAACRGRKPASRARCRASGPAAAPAHPGF